MSHPPPDHRLTVDADLALSIDGVEARLVGRRNALTLRTDEPARLASALRRSGVTAALPELARRASTAGLTPPTLIIEGPRGRVARIATGARGLRVRGLPTDARLQVYRPQDLVPTAVRWAIAAAGVAVALAIDLARRSRRT